MIRSFLTALLLLPLHFIGYAEITDILSVVTKQGDNYTFNLHELPAIIFSPDSLVIKTSKLTSSFDISDINMLQYNSSDDIITSISNHPICDQSCVYINEENIIIEGTTNDKIFIYSLTGILMISRVIDETGRISIGISDWNPGIYVISKNREQIKIQIK